MQAAIILMLVGAMLAGASEISFNILGCLWAIICVVTTACYLILIKVQKQSLGKSCPLHIERSLA